MRLRPTLRSFGWSIGIGCIALATIQFVRPKITNPPVSADLQAPLEIKQILRTSCYNCHSNETKLSWFDKPAPAYWIVARDVSEGRKHLNFSEAAKLAPTQQQGILFEAVSQIELGAMPLPAYKRVHPESVITAERLAVLRKYLSSGISNQAATPAQMSAADAQYDAWIQKGSAAPTVQAAPNGITFMPDYKDWKAISSTERSDNGTIREILGNDVALKAIAENHINPWPDGTALAKVAWYQLPDENGSVRTGAFFQVEFMIRDSQRYAGTLGWGWARWRGAD